MHKILVTIGDFLKSALEGIENFFKNTLAEIGKIISGVKTDIQPLFDALLAELKVLMKEAQTDITTALIASGKLLLTNLIVAL